MVLWLLVCGGVCVVGVSDTVCPGVTLYRVTSCFSVVDEMQLLKLTGHEGEAIHKSSPS